MGAITRWDPVAEMHAMRSMFDRLFEGRTARAGRADDELGTVTLGVDVYETDGEFVVRAPVAGIKPEDIQINIEDDVLSISGESKSEDRVEDERYLRRELRYGSFHRSLRLPPTVDAEKAEAEFDNGMLLLHLPKRAEAKPRSIRVTPRQAIEGSTGAVPPADDNA